jgi:hypothetical protein
MSAVSKCVSKETMGDSFSIERRTCETPGCGTKLLFFVDAQSVAVPGQRAMATCPHCRQATVIGAEAAEQVA